MKPAGIYKTHDLLTYISWSTDFDFGQTIKVKIFVQSRISSLLMVTSSYFILGCISEISRNIQEP